MRKCFILSLVVVLFSFLFHFNTVKAEKSEESNNDLTKETYEKLINEDVLDKKISYDTWLEINDDSLFDQLEGDFPDDPFSTDQISTLQKKTFTLKRGDILISNGTSSYGLTGHAGIVIGDNQILHIRGKGYKPAVYSVKTWQKRYGIVKGQQDGRTHTKVYRVGSSKKAKAAAKWAKDNYYKKNYSYGINTKINSKNPTYCSKIVWQAYKSQNLVNTPKSKIATPYGLPGYFKSSAKIKGIGIL